MVYYERIKILYLTNEQTKIWKEKNQHLLSTCIGRLKYIICTILMNDLTKT